MRSAMHALTGARELARPGEEVLILSDSDRDLHHDWRMYGAWALRKNKALVERNRRALAALRADGTAVRFQQPIYHRSTHERTSSLGPWLPTLGPVPHLSTWPMAAPHGSTQHRAPHAPQHTCG